MVNEMLRTLEDPHARHAAMVHLPIVLTLVGVLAAVALAFTRFRQRVLALVAVLAMVGASIGAGLAAGAGEEAYERVEKTPGMSAIEEEHLERHEELGEGGWKWPLGAAILLAGTLIPKRQVRVIAGVAGVIASIAVAGWAGWTGHTGGVLVYEHGLGVPQRGGSGGVESPAHAPSPKADEDD